jgi:hypothetical protein
VDTIARIRREVYDTDGFADPGAQPTRLTVPAGKGITRVQVLCGVQWAASSSGDRWVQIIKNGLEVDGMPGYLGPVDPTAARASPSPQPRSRWPTAIISSARSGRTRAAAWTSRPIPRPGSRSWPSSSRRHGQADRRRADRGQHGDRHPLGCHRVRHRRLLGLGNPTRLTVPSAVSRVRLLGNVRWQSNAAGERQMLVTKNGATFPGQPMARHGAAGLTGQNLAARPWR